MSRALNREDKVRVDRDIIEALVRRSGSSSLRQDVYDVRRAMQVDRGYSLWFPAELGRRLAELASGDKPVLTRVDGALAFVLDLPSRARALEQEAPRRRGGTNGPRVTAQYVLSSRLHELQHAREESLDDLERVVLALAIANLKLGGAAAPTRLVTQVMQTVPALTVSSTQQTNVLLGRLATRMEPVAREVKEDGARTSRWVLDASLRVEWMPWVQQTLRHYEQQLDHTTGPMADVGAVSQADVVARLVQKAVASTSSTTWPNGHPLSAREIAQIVSDARLTHDPHGLVPLQDALRRVGSDIPKALQAATRLAYGDGTKRRHHHVMRVDHPRLRSPAYVDGEYGNAMATAWADLTALRMETSRSVRARIAAEWTSCRDWLGAADGAVRAIALVRSLALRRIVDDLCGDAMSLRRRLAEVSGTHDAPLIKLHDEMAKVASDWPDEELLRAIAHEAMRTTSWSLASVLEAPRPHITSDELVAMLPSSLTDGISAAVFAASAVTVRRSDTAREGRTSRVGAGRTASLVLDRVDAVLYASETAMLPGVAAIQRGATLIGSTHAHVGLVRNALRSDVSDERVAAMGGLVLLGDITYLEKYARKRLLALGDITSLFEATSVVEVCWWMSKETRADAVTAALRDARQQVKAAGIRVRG